MAAPEMKEEKFSMAVCVCVGQIQQKQTLRAHSGSGGVASLGGC